MRTLLLPGCALLFAAGTAGVADSFQITGHGSLTVDAHAQDGGRFHLQADLSASAPGPAVAPAPLAGGGFVLSAVASANSLVCYNDTIFRDGFDGTGL